MSEANYTSLLLNNSKNDIENAFITSYCGYKVSLMVDSGMENFGAVRFQNIFEAPGYAGTFENIIKN